MHQLTRLSLHYPWLTLALIGALTLGLGAGVAKVKPANGFRVLVGEDHPAIQRLEGLIETYAGGYPFIIAWECVDGGFCQSPFDETSLRMAETMTRQISAAPGIDQVRSPSNTALLTPSETGLSIRHFIENGEIPEDSQALAALAVEDPLWKGKLVSADGRVAAIVVQPSDARSETSDAAMAAVEAALEPFEAAGAEFYLAGATPSATITGRDLSKSMGRVVPLLVLVLASVVFFLTRSWQQTLIALGTMGVALLWTFGMLGWLGWPQDSILQVLAPLLLAVGVCDAVHLLSRYAAERRRSEDRPDRALIAAARSINAACVVTTLTTAVAFASFTASRLDTFFRFGAIAAFGVIACLFLTFTLLPVLARALPMEAARAVRASAGWNRGLDSVVHFASRRPIAIVLASAALVLFLGAGGLSRLSVDQNWNRSFGEDTPTVVAANFVDRNLGSVHTLEIDLELPPGSAIEDPATLGVVSNLASGLEGVEGLENASSIVDLLARMNQLLHDNDPAYDRVGESFAANAELLELISMGDARAVGNWLSLDRSRLRLSMASHYMGQVGKGEVLEEARAVIAAVLPPGWKAELAGDIAVGHAWVLDVQRTQFTSFPLALLIVFGLVGGFLRSWKLGLAALVPPLLAAVFTLGTMGLLDMPLDVARAMIAAIVLGIGVDDSIHLLSHYGARRKAGQPARAAMRAAMRHTGRALVTTSIALSLGFLTLALSAWATISSFGLLVALAIAGALVAALLVLPAIVFAFARTEASLAASSSTPPGALAQEPR